MFSLYLLMPEDLRIAELCTINRNDRIVLVLGERVTTISRIGYVLRLFLRRIQRVDSHDSVGLIWKEARGIVRINDSRATENSLALTTWEKSDRLIGPVVQVAARGMTPRA